MWGTMLSYDTSTSTQITPDWTQCRNLCFRRDAVGTCSGFWFQNTTSICTLSSDTLYRLGVPTASSQAKPGANDTLYYSTDCFTCSSSCPSPVGANLFDNPGFELGDKYYGPWAQSDPIEEGPYGSVVQGGSAGSQRSFRMGNNSQLILSQGFNGCQNTLYKVSVDYRFVCHGTCKPSLAIASAGDWTLQDVGLYNASVQLFTNGSWATISGYAYAMPVGDKTKVEGGVLQLKMYGTGTFDGYFDNAIAIPINKTLTPSALAADSFVNGGFETGKLSPWYPDSTMSTAVKAAGAVMSPGLNGTKYALNMTGKYPFQYRLYQDLPALTLGKEYVLSFDFKTTNYTTTSMYVGGNGFSWTFCADGTAKDKTCAGTVRRPFIAAYTSGFFQFSTYFGNWQVPTTCLIDNVSLKMLS